MKITPLFFPVTLCILLANASPAFADSCVTASCHQTIGGLKNPHQPVKDGDCLSCHRQQAGEHPVKGGKSFELTAKGAALCSQCHDPKGKMKVVHPPVKEGDCISCHKPHGAAGRFLLDVGENQTDLCTGCHDAAPFKQRFMHAPAAVGTCTKCHDPHEAAEKSLLKDSVRNMCLNCHGNLAKSLMEPQVVHPPVKDGPCTACHNPHGAPAASLLRKKMPDICVECHGKIGKLLAGAKVLHKPIQGEGSCGSCHSAHYSGAKGLLQKDEKSTCLGCHGTDNLGNPPLRNIGKQLEGKKYLHGPLQKGECKGCHDPHGSDFFRMLRGGYPAEIYVPYREGIYDACLKCHEKSMLRYAETTIYTRFRNGSRNLHFVHVVNTRKGRTCRVCHEPHASDGEKLVSKEGTSFGEWRIPLNFKTTPTGGSCLPGCHRAVKYDRNKPEEY